MAGSCRWREEHVPGLKQAAVVARPDPTGARQIYAYVVLDPSSRSDVPLRPLVSQRLPSYMVPHQFQVVATLPLTTHGKVDRKALIALEPPSSSSAALETTATPLAQQILEIWRTLFQRPDLGQDDDFFALGGHSLLATRVVSRVNQAFACDLTIQAVFDHPTVRALALHVAAAPKTGGDRTIRPRARRTG